LQKLKLFVVSTIALCALLPFGSTIAQTDWEFNASLYGWFAGIDGTVGVAILQEQVDATPSDLFKNLEFTAGGHFEARNPNISLIADVFYMGLKQDAEIQRTILNQTITKTGEVNLDEWVAEGAVGYRTSKQFEILLAVRFYDINTEILTEGSSGSASKSWVDGFFGARYKTDFADDWYTSARIDIGMGGSAFAWFGNAELGYRFSELFSLSFNYRILSVDYEEGSGKDYFKYDTFNHGFGLAAVFSF
jgi:hypothetical protein